MAKTALIQGLRRTDRIARFAQRRNLSLATALEMISYRTRINYDIYAPHQTDRSRCQSHR